MTNFITGKKNGNCLNQSTVNEENPPTSSAKKAKKSTTEKIVTYDKEEALLREVQKRTPLYIKSNDVELLSQDNINRLWSEVVQALKPKCK